MKTKLKTLFENNEYIACALCLILLMIAILNVPLEINLPTSFFIYLRWLITLTSICLVMNSPQFVRPFVKSNKNDFIDAEAICEAASRPSMRFVQPRTETQQAMRALHRVRESLIRDKVKTTNQIYGFLLEFGISLPTGITCALSLSY